MSAWSVKENEKNEGESENPTFFLATKTSIEQGRRSKCRLVSRETERSSCRPFPRRSPGSYSRRCWAVITVVPARNPSWSEWSFCLLCCLWGHSINAVTYYCCTSHERAFDALVGLLVSGHHLIPGRSGHHRHGLQAALHVSVARWRLAVAHVHQVDRRGSHVTKPAAVAGWTDFVLLSRRILQGQASAGWRFLVRRRRLRSRRREESALRRTLRCQMRRAEGAIWGGKRSTLVIGRLSRRDEQCSTLMNLDTRWSNNNNNINKGRKIVSAVSTRFRKSFTLNCVKWIYFHSKLKIWWNINIWWIMNSHHSGSCQEWAPSSAACWSGWRTGASSATAFVPRTWISVSWA